eukprot:COSAG01_NODE_12387_length_1748_cov_1.427879_2_plen_334_part_00
MWARGGLEEAVDASDVEVRLIELIVQHEERRLSGARAPSSASSSLQPGPEPGPELGLEPQPEPEPQSQPQLQPQEAPEIMPAPAARGAEHGQSAAQVPALARVTPRRAVVRRSSGRGSGEHPLLWRRASNASWWPASLLLLVAALGPAAARTPGFPCQEDEWVNATWHPPQEPQCHSCYDCTVGQVCRQRGGCFNCAPGEFDDDGNPLKPCVACPAGKTSESEAATACTEVQKKWYEEAFEWWTQMDSWAQGVFGTGLGVVVLGVITWCCGGCKDGRQGLCQELRKRCGCGEGDGYDSVGGGTDEETGNGQPRSKVRPGAAVSPPRALACLHG